MEDITWINVASDAVKIGLGAMIGALASIVVTSQKHRHVESLEYSNRRRDLLENVMPKFDDASLKAMNFVVQFTEALPEEEGIEHDVDEERFSFNERAKEILNCNSELNLVESNVALLGEKELANKVENFRHTFRILVEKKRAERASTIETFQSLSDLRYEIIDEFAEAYKSA